MKFFPLLAFLSILAVSCSEQASQKQESPEAIDGKSLFMANCSQCHRPNEDFLGPELKGVTKRWSDQKRLYDFIRNSQDVIARDPYAKQVYEKWNRAYMQPFPQLSDEQIKAILRYCDTAD